LVKGCNEHTATVAVLENPPLVAMKNLAWDAIARTIMSAAAPTTVRTGR
jgi:hypothetical protein